MAWELWPSWASWCPLPRKNEIMPVVCARYSSDLIADPKGFGAELRRVILHEWARVRNGPAIDPSVDLAELDLLLAACHTGNIIPGLAPDPGTGVCSMDWRELACFSGWYARLDRVGGELSRVALSEGLLPWEEQQSDYDWPPGPVVCGPTLAGEAALWCCPEAVFSDPDYDSRTGVWASRNKSKPWWKLALGIGAAVAAVGIVTTEIGRSR